MEYEGQICRPPMERASFMLAISVGCAYNRCKFCNLFKHLKWLYARVGCPDARPGVLS